MNCRPNRVGAYIDPQSYDACVTKLREFFHSRGFVEAHPQSLLSILAACEDPNNLATFNYSGKVYPLPQTGQMHLEDILLLNPTLKGLFCVTTSYRNEPNPQPGRHDKIFPLFEFESWGDMQDLENLTRDLCKHLGFKVDVERWDEISQDYEKVANHYKVKELEHEHEDAVCKDNNTPCFWLKNFPQYTSPFWNMKKSPDGEYSKKIDVIICGQETMGTAERSCNKEEMRKHFEEITNGEYAKTLYSQFGRERVNGEMDEFLSHGFKKRFGGGIGVTRLIRGMKQEGLL